MELKPARRRQHHRAQQVLIVPFMELKRRSALEKRVFEKS